METVPIHVEPSTSLYPGLHEQTRDPGVSLQK